MTFMKPNHRFVIVSLAVAAIAFIAIAAGGINDNLVYYWTPTDLHAAGDKAYGATIRLGGMVSAGSIRPTSSRRWCARADRSSPRAPSTIGVD